MKGLYQISILVSGQQLAIRGLYQIAQLQDRNQYNTNRIDNCSFCTRTAVTATPYFLQCLYLQSFQ